MANKISQSYLVIPLFVAMIRIGAISLSKARFKNEKLSMSNMCTSSMNNTCKKKPGKYDLHVIFHLHMFVDTKMDGWMTFNFHPFQQYFSQDG